MAIQGPGSTRGPGGGFLRRFDNNGDGQIDQSEADSFAQHLSGKMGVDVSGADIMARLDADGDGVISKSERTVRPRRSGAHDALDPSRLELMARRISAQTGREVSSEELLAQIDADGDGAVSQQERTAMRDRIRSQMLAARFRSS